MSPLTDPIDRRLADRSHPDRIDFWDPNITYVVGHQRPDTDAIASAMGFAWFLTSSGHDAIRAGRAGQPGDQTLFALKRFNETAPALLSGVAPTFGHIADPEAVVLPDAPLSAAMARFVAGEQVVPVVDAERRPAGVVTPLGLARAFSHNLSDEEQGRAPTCREVGTRIPTFNERDRISDHRSALLRMDENHFLVVDGHGYYVGMATQRSVLQPPRAKLILVDHNELGQAVPGADEAQIVGVLDHHRLGNPPTAEPIPFVVDPVGSTSTLVAERCRDRALHPPRGIAGMLLSGILSDTLVFRSPTTGARDRAAAAWLAHLCGVEIAQYGEELLHAAPGLGARTAGEILDGDRKTYSMADIPISIGQIEVTGMQELPQRVGELVAAMDQRREREGLGMICLMVTDIVTGRSRLLCRGDSRILGALPYARLSDVEFDLGDIVSRKKQLVPALYGLVEAGL
ncbi:MAG TPA: DHHA2 domain-containing protein [Armatimonadaceae bacterium]|nr:DHHA2 domain-containing protein [Armatimonadaceae bacterium]